MSATIVIDLGMNSYERGRLIKHLTEFSTQRFLGLSSLASFRFFNDALNVLAARLTNATNVWTSGANAAGTAGADDQQTSAQRSGLTHDQRFIGELQDLIKDLTMLNALVDGGIPSHCATVEASRSRITSHLDAIEHRGLPGFMSLTDFLERRFLKSVRTISNVGRRYDLLRQRVAELSALAEAKVQIEQNESQTQLLNKVDRLTLFGIVYYAGQIAAYIVMFVLVMNAWREGEKFDPHEYEPTFELVKFIAYPLATIAAIWIGLEVLGLLGKEFRDSKPTRWLARHRWLIWTAAIVSLTAGLLLMSGH